MNKKIILIILAAITIFTLATLLIIHKALKNKDKGDEHG